VNPNPEPLTSAEKSPEPVLSVERSISRELEDHFTKIESLNAKMRGVVKAQTPRETHLE
jgi:hypothetical protein